jgi:hypothetical protein
MPTDPIQDRREQFPRHGHLSQLERDDLGMADDLCPDLDQLLAQRRQRPRPYRMGQSQPAQEVTQVVGQGKQLQPDLVVLEPATRQPRPFKDGAASSGFLRLLVRAFVFG